MEEKKYKAEQIRRILNNTIKKPQKVSGFISEITKLNKNFFTENLIDQFGNDESYWYNLFNNHENNQHKRQYKIDIITHFLASFNDENVYKYTTQYLDLILEKISVDYGTAFIMNIPDQYQNDMLNFYYSIDINDKPHFLESIVNYLNAPTYLLDEIIDKIKLLETFRPFATIKHSAVLIGANGSGKSTFSRSLRDVFSSSMTIISAQKVFWVGDIESIPIGDQQLSSVHKYQSSDKLGNNTNERYDYSGDLHNLVLALISEHFKIADESFNNDGQRDKQSSPLFEVIDIWNELIPHRKMIYRRPFVKIKYKDSEPEYDFMELSDGEKAMFYYVANVILAKNDSYIIVDEPENHLHVGIVSKLWDLLERKKPNCKFIYLTHNLDFASSRHQAEKFWNKKFTPPDFWAVKPLPIREDLPEALLMEVLGSRKAILFCEGSKSSLDYRLYSLLFPECTIKPVGGHQQVIDYTRAFNNANEIFNNTAIGIIDGDYHSNEEIDSWEKSDVFCIEVQEVENLLCDEMLLEVAKEELFADENSVTEAKNELFRMIDKFKEKQAVDYATQIINNRLKGSLITKTNTKEELNIAFENAYNSINIESLVEERINLFNEIISSENYSSGLKHFNNKGILAIIGSKIDNKYRDKIFRVLESNPELLNKFRQAHFSHVVKHLNTLNLP
ncbi:MAG: AAA family ATPase [Fibrobacter sp.]|nr:AAA family ATPase [Fibrobacter sp.]